jgi:uncharacterized protein YrrD
MRGRDASELLSKPVFATTEGREVGRVKDVLFDPDAQALLGLMVSPADGVDSEMFVQRDSIVGLGRDAVTVETAEAVEPLAQRAEAREIIETGIHIKGAKVFTEGGNSIGTIDKIYVEDNGDIACYGAASGLLGFGDKSEIDPNCVVKVGEDAIIVSEDALARSVDEAETASERRGSRPS